VLSPVIAGRMASAWVFTLPAAGLVGAGAYELAHGIGDSVLGAVIAAICFLIILAAIGWGIYEVYQIGHPPAKH
jgi:uncharacterized membrane protein